MGFKDFMKGRSLRVKDSKRTKAAELTLRESIYPIALVTVLFFLWGFSYGLLDTLNVSYWLCSPCRMIHYLWQNSSPAKPLIPSSNLLIYYRKRALLTNNYRNIFRIPCILPRRDRPVFKEHTSGSFRPHPQLPRKCSLTNCIHSAYPLASLGHANWILRHYGYRATFMWGLFLYGMFNIATPRDSKDS